MTTEREKAFGNQIFFSTNRLQYASIQDKINYVVQMGDRGRTSINEDREVFNLPPIEGGERHFIRGEYRPVDSYGEPPEPVETLDGNTTVDKSVGGGIMEERRNDGSHYTKDEHGRFTGSTGGGSSGGSSGSGSGKESDSSKSPKSEDKTVGIENVTGKTATIDKRKFVEYALNPQKQPDKARAFKDALGYDVTNYQQLEAQIREKFDREKMKYKADSGYGKKYELQMELQGANGKKAKVMTGWIDDAVKNDFHLTSVYVDK